MTQTPSSSPDLYAPFEALLADPQFWEEYANTLARQAYPEFVKVFGAGAVAGAKLKPPYPGYRRPPKQKHYVGTAHDLDQSVHAGHGRHLRPGGYLTGKAEVIASLDGQYREPVTHLSDEVLDSVENYASPGGRVNYREINMLLREGPRLDLSGSRAEETRRNIENLDTAFNTLPRLEQGVVVFRSGRPEPHPGEEGAFRDLGYTSTSVNPQETNLFVGEQVAIRVPAGTRVLPVSLAKEEVDRRFWEEDKAEHPELYEEGSEDALSVPVPTMAAGEEELLLPRGAVYRDTGETMVNPTTGRPWPVLELVGVDRETKAPDWREKAHKPGHADAPNRFTWVEGDTEPFSLDELTIEKHLPGQHNQQLHGGGGVATAAPLLTDPIAVADSLKRQQGAWARRENQRHPDAVEAVDIYAGTGYRNMNLVLRYGTRTELVQDWQVEDWRTYGRKNTREMDAAFDRLPPLDEGILVFRNGRFEDYEGFRDDGFGSTSIDPHVASKFQGPQVAIRVPAGQKAMSVGMLKSSRYEQTGLAALDAASESSALWGEAEVLLPRGTIYRNTGETHTYTQRAPVLGFNDREVTVPVYEVVGVERLPLTQRKAAAPAPSTPEQDKYTWHPGDVVPLKKSDLVKRHYPGGQDHDQSTHGRGHTPGGGGAAEAARLKQDEQKLNSGEAHMGTLWGTLKDHPDGTGFTIATSEQRGGEGFTTEHRGFVENGYLYLIPGDGNPPRQFHTGDEVANRFIARAKLHSPAETQAGLDEHYGTDPWGQAMAGGRSYTRDDYYDTARPPGSPSPDRDLLPAGPRTLSITLSAYSDVNRELRGQSPQMAGVTQLMTNREAIEQADRILANAPPIKADRVVFRGAGPGTVARLLEASQSPDRLYRDDGYLETTASIGEARSYADSYAYSPSGPGRPGALVAVNVPEGSTRVAAIANNSDYPHEQEVLIGRGATYRVDAYAGTEDVVQPGGAFTGPKDRQNHRFVLTLVDVPPPEPLPATDPNVRLTENTVTRHYPGGQDHDQSTHGRGGKKPSGSPFPFAEQRILQAEADDGNGWGAFLDEAIELPTGTGWEVVVHDDPVPGNIRTIRGVIDDGVPYAYHEEAITGGSIGVGQPVAYDTAMTRPRGPVRAVRLHTDDGPVDNYPDTPFGRAMRDSRRRDDLADDPDMMGPSMIPPGMGGNLRLTQGGNGINHALRTGSGQAHIRFGIEQADQLTAAAPPTKQEKVLFRGIGQAERAQLDNLALGQTFTIPTFAETSPNLGVAAGFGTGGPAMGAGLVAIRVPEGSRGVASAAYISDYPAEHETVIARGATYRLDDAAQTLVDRSPTGGPFETGGAVYWPTYTLTLVDTPATPPAMPAFVERTVERHYPGGHDHDQSTHGRGRGGGGASGAPAGPSALDKEGLAHAEGWLKKMGEAREAQGKIRPEGQFTFEAQSDLAGIARSPGFPPGAKVAFQIDAEDEGGPYILRGHIQDGEVFYYQLGGDEVRNTRIRLRPPVNDDPPVQFGGRSRQLTLEAGADPRSHYPDTPLGRAHADSLDRPHADSSDYDPDSPGPPPPRTARLGIGLTHETGINSTLRDPMGINAADLDREIGMLGAERLSVRDIVREADEFIEAAPPTSQEKILWRGAGDGTLARAIETGEGGLFTDPGVMETSQSYTRSQDFGEPESGPPTVVAIRVPQGSEGVATLGGRSEYPQEQEVMIARGAVYRIDQIDPETKSVVMTLVDTPESPPPLGQGMPGVPTQQPVELTLVQRHTPGGHPHDQSTHGGKGAAGGSPELRAKAREVEKLIRTQPTESGVIFRPDGTSEQVTSGRETSISLTDAQIASLKGATFTHNHPLKGAPLSWGDVAVGVSGGALEMRSISKDGYVSVIKAPPGGWENAKPGKNGRTPYEAIVSPRVVFGAMRAQTESKGQKGINDFMQGVLRDFAKETGATYWYGKAGDEP